MTNEVIKAQQAEKFNKENFLTEYYTNGFYRFDAREVLENFDIEKFGKFPDVLQEDKYYAGDGLKGFDVERQTMLIDLRERLREAYFYDLNVELDFYSALDKAEGNSNEWHNDLIDLLDLPEFQGHVSVINCYFDDVNSKTGGKLLYHRTIPDRNEWKKNWLDSDPGTVSTYINKFDCIIFNHTLDFIHKVQPTEFRRRILFYFVKFKDF